MIDDRSYRTEIEEEVLDHLECAAAAWEAQGVKPDEARRRAMVDFGNPDRIGKLLQQTKRGGVVTRIVRLAGLGGLVSAALCGLVIAESSLARQVRAYLQHHLLIDRNGNSVVLLFFALSVLALVGFALRHAQNRYERIGLMIAPALATALFGLGAVGLGWNVMVSGILAIGVGLAIAGGFLVRRHARSHMLVGLVMLVTGLLPCLFPFLGPYSGLKPSGIMITQFFALGWAVLGITLLLGRAANAERARQIA